LLAGVGEVVCGVFMLQGRSVRYAPVMSILGGLSGLLMCTGMTVFALEIVVTVLLAQEDVRRWMIEQEEPALLAEF
jgi:hypothetical protein